MLGPKSDRPRNRVSFEPHADVPSRRASVSHQQRSRSRSRSHGVHEFLSPGNVPLPPEYPQPFPHLPLPYGTPYPIPFRPTDYGPWPQPAHPYPPSGYYPPWSGDYEPDRHYGRGYHGGRDDYGHKYGRDDYDDEYYLGADGAQRIWKQPSKDRLRSQYPAGAPRAHDYETEEIIIRESPWRHYGSSEQPRYEEEILIRRPRSRDRHRPNSFGPGHHPIEPEAAPHRNIDRNNYHIRDKIRKPSRSSTFDSYGPEIIQINANENRHDRRRNSYREEIISDFAHYSAPGITVNPAKTQRAPSRSHSKIYLEKDWAVVPWNEDGTRARTARLRRSRPYGQSGSSSDEPRRRFRRESDLRRKMTDDLIESKLKSELEAKRKAEKASAKAKVEKEDDIIKKYMQYASNTRTSSTEDTAKTNKVYTRTPAEPSVRPVEPVKLTNRFLNPTARQINNFTPSPILQGPQAFTQIYEEPGTIGDDLARSHTGNPAALETIVEMDERGRIHSVNSDSSSTARRQDSTSTNAEDTDELSPPRSLRRKGNFDSNSAGVSPAPRSPRHPVPPQRPTTQESLRPEMATAGRIHRKSQNERRGDASSSTSANRHRSSNVTQSPPNPPIITPPTTLGSVHARQSSSQAERFEHRPERRPRRPRGGDATTSSSTSNPVLLAVSDAAITPTGRLSATGSSTAQNQATHGQHQSRSIPRSRDPRPRDVPPRVPEDSRTNEGDSSADDLPEPQRSRSRSRRPSPRR